MVKSFVNDRVEKLSLEARVDLFCELEACANTSDLLTNIIMTEAANALDELIFKVNCCTGMRLQLNACFTN